MLRRNGVGASTSLAPVAHAEDAQPNEVSKKRKGQGLPPIVASSKPPARTFYNHRGRGGATIRGGYRGGKGSDKGVSTQYAMRGGKSSWRGHRNPSGSWPKRADSAFGSPHDPSSNSRPAVSIAIPPLPPTAVQSGIDKGKAPMRGGGEQSMNKSWHRRDGVATVRNTEQEKRASPWGQQPDSGYAQRAVPRQTAPPKVDGTSQAPLPHCNPLHPSLPARPPPQSSPQSPPQYSSFLFQSEPKDSREPAATEWYMRIGSPDPKLPPGSLGRKNPQPPSTISMPLPGRLRKFQAKQDVRNAAENSPSIPPQLEPVASLPVASPVHQKPQSKAELSQVPIPPNIPKAPLPKHCSAELVKLANEPSTENLPFVLPEDEANVYKAVPLSEQRKSRSKPRDLSTDGLTPVPQQEESAARRSRPLSQQSKAPAQPQRDIEPSSASAPSSSKLQPQPPRQSKVGVSLATKSPEMDALSFLPPQGASGTYVPVPISLQRQSRVSLYAMPPTPEPETGDPPFIPPQEVSLVHVPAPLSQQRKSQSKAQVDVNDFSSNISRVVAQPILMRNRAQVPEPNVHHRTGAGHEDTMKSDVVLSTKIAAIRMKASISLPPIETLSQVSSTGSSAHDDLVALPPPEASSLAEVPPTTPLPVTPRKTKTVQAVNTSTSAGPKTGVRSPEVVIKKEEQLSPLSQSPIKPARKLVTEAASFYPMPASCDKAVLEYKENRKAFFKENSKILSALGLKRTKAFFRDDGLVIEWKSDVPVWSDTLKPEENNLATAMEEFLKRSAERSGSKRKRKEKASQDLDGGEPSPGAKRIKTFKGVDPVHPSERKRKFSDFEETSSPEQRKKTAGSSSVSGGLISGSTSRRLPNATNHPLESSFGDVAASKDEQIYIFSSPEPSPEPTLKPLPSATAKKVPLPTRLPLTKKPNAVLAPAPSTNTSHSNSNSTGALSTGAADFDSERVKMSARTSVDPTETVPPATSQTGVRVPASGPPHSSRRMIFKPTNPSRTSRVTPAAHVSASALSAEERGIGHHGVGGEHVTDSDRIAALTLPGSTPGGRSTSRTYSPSVPNDVLLPAQMEVNDRESVMHRVANGSVSPNRPLAIETAMSAISDAEDQVLKDDGSDMYCSDREDVQEDDEDEDDESKLAVDFFTRFITLFDSDRSKLTSATSMAEHFAPESKLVFHSSHSNASASTVEHGRSRICDRLREMGPHKFRALPGSVVWDLAPLPLDSPGYLMFSVHGEVVDPSHTGRHLDHILTVDQTFVLRPRNEDDNGHEEELWSDSLHDDEEWPLVAVSHQMTVRESRLLPPDAIENLLPWVVNVES
ncbi:hypothetical protein D9619_006639 [Psilocybe cf. subviscida]|uniref:NTF2 domain-containing protein n=1 Tax=Psilocybe cf. subviscida TaxID=2480587 RepID=A0A8H5B4F2_9AGAR|nr:hypothetical protein D9619_006639 [Psilocybe cf. subviscida]